MFIVLKEDIVTHPQLMLVKLINYRLKFEFPITSSNASISLCDTWHEHICGHMLILFHCRCFVNSYTGAKSKYNFVSSQFCQVKNFWIVFFRLKFFFRNFRKTLQCNQHWFYNSHKSLNVFIGETIHTFCNRAQNCLILSPLLHNENILNIGHSELNRILKEQL